MRDLLDASNQTRDMCESVASDLEHLAYSFREVGNSKVAGNLEFNAKRLRIAAEVIDKATGDAIYASAREAEQSFFNTVNAALAGIKVGSNAK